MDDWGKPHTIPLHPIPRVLINWTFIFLLFLETLADDPAPVVIPPKVVNANKWEGEDEEEDVKVFSCFFLNISANIGDDDVQTVFVVFVKLMWGYGRI